jgi:predicted PurR-regulated permease PerM
MAIGNSDNQPQNSETPDRLVLLQRQLTVLVLLLLAIFLCFQVGSYFSDMFRILGYSILLFYLFINIVDWLDSLLHNRVMAILIVYLGLLGITVFSVIILFPALIYQISQLINTTFNQLPQLLQNLISLLSPLEARLHAASIRISSIDILNNIASSMPKPDASLVLGRMTDMAMSTMTWLVYGLSVIVVSFYFLLDGKNMKDSVLKLFPKRYYLTLTVLVTDIDLSLQMFFRGQIVLGLLFGLFMIAVFLSLGVHYALLLGGFLGVCEIIPVIGPTIGFVPILLTVAFDGMDNIYLNRFGQVLIILIVLNLVQWLKDNIVAPKYIGNVIGLHPVMIFIAIMIGARLDGLSGVVCALPVACVMNVLANHLSVRLGAGKSILVEAESRDQSFEAEVKTTSEDKATPSESFGVEPAHESAESVAARGLSTIKPEPRGAKQLESPQDPEGGLRADLNASGAAKRDPNAHTAEILDDL